LGDFWHFAQKAAAISANSGRSDIIAIGGMVFRLCREGNGI